MEQTQCRRPVLILAGPTASGKSAAALSAADSAPLGVVNADSMQVYRDLRLLTARPSPDEEAAAPHRLFGHVDAGLAWSAARWAEDAVGAIRDLWAIGLTPLLVGGTGLYLRALIDGLSEMPVVPDHVRDAVRAESFGLPAPELHARLTRLDPETASGLRPSDTQRILRALEVFAATGEPLARFQARPPAPPLPEADFRPLVIDPDREALRARIDQRFVAMIGAGALDEVARLAARGLDPALPAMRAHGVPALMAHLRGEIGLDAAIARGQADTRAYARRQFTWFRGQAPAWPRVAAEDAAAALVALARD